MKESKGNNILLTIIGIATLLVAVIGATFAYFTAVLSNNETGTSITINSGTLGITFVGGSSINIQNIYPRGNPAALVATDAWATKTFSVMGNTTAAANINYALALSVNSNGFSADALKYTLAVDPGSSTNGNKAPAISATSVPTTPGSYSIGSSCYFAGPTGGNVTHTYILSIFFPDTGSNQNTDQGKTFEAHVEISST